jgi:putative transposase
MHYSVIHLLIDNFDTILLPRFETQNMVKKENRKIGRKTAREMLTWSHYEFKQRLLFKAKLAGVTVHSVGEEYTTVSCGLCGLINPEIEGSKTFWCNGCGLKGVDRDVHAARNILLKHLA